MSSNKFTSIFKRNKSQPSMGTPAGDYTSLHSNESSATLVNPAVHRSPAQPPRQQNTLSAFGGSLADTYGFGAAFGPPPTNPPGVASKKNKLPSSTPFATPSAPSGPSSRDHSTPQPSVSSQAPTPFGALSGTYGFGGSYGPPPSNPPGIASKKK
ncbi:hypothetical protein K488DRAFT_82210 [Vararia minispora EC-137]|uniref:Uncharacterized protein n=1 Tax=Vararia minispora EC-137 TaxID=1314806 RepID=A0ACB8QX80_9AGAM|nr:hypothetical protein K488DRAFT_82210 [Vararia minispora EC-137]